MRKISEVIKLALPLHAAAKPSDINSTGLCFAMNDMRRRGLLGFDEYQQARSYISYNVIPNYGYLKHKLQAQKKASSQAARVAFYQRLVTKLEKKGL